MTEQLQANPIFLLVIFIFGLGILILYVNHTQKKYQNPFKNKAEINLMRLTALLWLLTLILPLTALLGWKFVLIPLSLVYILAAARVLYMQRKAGFSFSFSSGLISRNKVNKKFAWIGMVLFALLILATWKIAGIF